MKQIILTALIAGAMCLPGCVSIYEYDKEKHSVIDKSAHYIFEMRDGSRITGSKLKWQRAEGFNGTSITLDGKKLAYEDIVRYQDKNGVFYRMANGKWAGLLRRGKIDLYHFDVSVVVGHHTGAGGSQMVDEASNDHYVFSKNGSEPVELTRRQIADLLRDNQAAYQLFISHWQPSDQLLPVSGALHNIIAVVERYNQ